MHQYKSLKNGKMHSLKVDGLCQLFNLCTTYTRAMKLVYFELLLKQCFKLI